MAEADDLHGAATALLRKGRHEEAERTFRRLLAASSPVEEQYDEWLDGLVGAYRALGRGREAAHVLVYLQRFAEAHPIFVAERALVEAARCQELWARSIGRRSARHPAKAPRASARRERSGRDPQAMAVRAEALHLAAARQYEQVGFHVHAAIGYALARAPGEARREWERVAHDPRLVERRYERALCHFNLGLAARSGARTNNGHHDAPPATGNAGGSVAEAADHHLVQAQRLLEEVADDFEAGGDRERAFYCYALLIHLGREEGSFENLAEGYINCLRIMKEDNFRFYTLQYYEDFLRIAVEREEFHAAATLFREAADYARRAGLPYDRSYLKRSAETWWKAADKNERDGGAVELTENAYLAAIDGYSGLGDFYRVRESYRRLAALALPEPKRERYRRVAARYPDLPEKEIDVPPFPDYLHHPHAYPRTWETDLVEWELDGDHAAVCASILGDPAHAGKIRRSALEVVLLDLDGKRGPAARADGTARLASIAELLGDLWLYQALSPLERLYDHAHPSVRLGVMTALRHLHFKRSFPLLDRGLRDPAPEVRDAAIESLEALHYRHLFEPLVRIFREHAEHAVRVTALTAIGRIGSLDAAEFLIDVLRHESAGLRDVARHLLGQIEHPQLGSVLRRHLEVESGPARGALEQILRGGR